jgi:glycosyltransferase involved in cell wall biosynthesis
MSPPRVCLVGLANLRMLAPEYGRLGAGGAELQQTLLAKALVRHGFDVCMVVADHGQPDGAVWDSVRTYKAYPPEAGIPVLRFVHPRWTGMWAALQRADADVYYTMCAGALLGQLALFARRHRRRLVFGVASDSDCDPRSMLVRYWRDRKLYLYGLKRADVVLAQTEQQQRTLLRNFGRDSRIVEALADECGRRLEFPERDLDVLWVANLRALKRPRLLLEAARRLPQLRFHMVGGPYFGERELFEAVRAEAQTLPNVTFHGPVPYREVREFFERARVLVHTSETEGFPNSYVQAWTHGVPVVAFLDPDGLIARHGLGRSVTSLEQMVEAVAALTGDVSAWEAASRRSREYMDKRFAESRIMAPYLEALAGPGELGAA